MTNKQFKYLEATGDIDYNMTNDYMFRVVLQQNQDTLIGLVSSSLHMKPNAIKNIQILNPIVLGDSIADKEYRMDLLVLLNSNTTLNIEMQVTHIKAWVNRSLGYLCRAFDDINHGQPYSDMKPVFQISFLDFTLFEEHPEFYSTYQMRNIKDGYLYSSNLNVCVIELNHTDMATEEDKAYGIDTWAKLFKAKTWEEIKMITENNESLQSTAESIFLSNSDLVIRKQCRDREDYYREKEHAEKIIAEQAATIADKNATIAEKDAAIADKDAAIADKDALLKRYMDKYGSLDD